MTNNKIMRTASKTSSGQSMTEFVVLLPVLLMLITGAIQFAFIYSAKTTLNYATFQAARLSAVKNASYQAARRGLIRGMAPMFTHAANDDAIAAGIETATVEVDNYMQVTRLNPTLDHFRPGVHGQYDDEGDLYIPNDNLMFRDSSLRGNPPLSIQDANLLKIEVRYCFELVVPYISNIISAWFTEGDADLGVTGNSNYYTTGAGDICNSADEGLRRGIVLTSSSIMRMQSPAYENFD